MHPELRPKENFPDSTFSVIASNCTIIEIRRTDGSWLKVARIEVVKGVLKSQIFAAAGYNAYEIHKEFRLSESKFDGSVHASKELPSLQAQIGLDWGEQLEVSSSQTNP